MAKFKKSVLDKIKADPDLYSAVAKAMDVKPSSLVTIIDRNGNNINQFSIVTLVAGFLNENPEDLVEESDVKEVQDTATGN